MPSQASAKKVFVGLSGGVDSSVSAALLKKTGYDVTGVFIRVWQGDADARGLERGFTPMTEASRCQAADDRLDAMRVCAKLGIPFVELNLEKEYKKEVVDYMIREYKAGRTPNPDVMCNRHIKFGAFYDWAMKRGADFVATGHYARVALDATREARNPKSEIRNKSEIINSKLQATKGKLLTGLDANKDQSYFLWQLRQEQLPHILFPVGGMEKPEVRRLAKKFGLITAGKKDSQGLCFVGKVDMKEFLSRFIKPKKGKVLDEDGKVIGEHDGAAFFTLGERHGFNITQINADKKTRMNADIPSAEISLNNRRLSAGRKPYYVVAKDIRKNTVTVSHDPKIPVAGGSRTIFEIEKVNWIGAAPAAGAALSARLRYRQPLQKTRFKIRDSRFTVHFESAQNGGAPGQSIVFYDGERCLGGGALFDGAVFLFLML